MLAIRMQRTGRKGHASFRVIVQDSRFAPSSGRVVARLGHHDPHTKETTVNKELAVQYLKNGAQPSPRVIRLFEAQKIGLPTWVKKPSLDKKREIKNPEKLRRNQPAEETPAPEEAPVAEVAEPEEPKEEASKEAEKPAEVTDTQDVEESKDKADTSN